jgi:hypothetical protein
MNSLSFPKYSGSHADLLAAVGAADLLQDLKSVLADRGYSIEVLLSRDIVRSDLNGVGPGFKYLKAKPESDDGEKPARKPAGAKKKANAKLPPCVPGALVFDYAAESEKYKRDMAAKNSKDADISILEAAQQDKPDPDFRMYRIAKALQADSGLNNFVEQFCALGASERETAIYQGITKPASFFLDSPTVQLFNPQAAKGYSLIKPTGTDRNDKTKEKWAVPFWEWLRYRGFFSGCAGWFLGSKGEHIRVYTLIPREIRFSLYSSIASDLRAEPLAGSAAKLDCLATLRMIRILIERSEVFRPPSKSISGVWVTHYQSLGQVKAVMSIEQLGTPDWVSLDAAGWLQTLEEHDKVLRRLNDDVSDELALLKQYRIFLQTSSSTAINELVEFFALFGHYIFRLRGQGKWLLPQFTRDNVEALLQPTYKQILENVGFRAITDAMRSATVSAQVAKKRSSDYREIQYGLLPELRRKIAEGRDAFLQAVSDFVSDFNIESARRYELGKTGYRISQDDFAAFVKLVGEQDEWETVGRLLCAMSTCKLGKEEKDETPE